MSSIAYHRSPRLDESGVRSELTDDPWLEDKTTTPYRRGAVPPNNMLEHAASANRPQPRAAWPHAPAASMRHATTLKVTPIRPTRRAAKRPRTADQVSEAALESFWREQERVRVRARSARKIGLLVVAGAALLGALALILFARGALPKIPWQKPPEVNLADLLTSQHATPTPAGTAGAVSDSPMSSPDSAPQLDEPNELAHEAAAATSANPQRSSVVVTQPDPGAPLLPATLRVDSQPRARVFIDDVLIGNTPQLSITLQPGLHELRLHNPELVLLRNITLDVKPGETISRVERLDL